MDFIEDDRLFIAPAFIWRPGEATTLTFLSEYKQDETHSSQALPAVGTLSSNPNGSIPVNRFTGEPDVDQYERADFSIGYLFEHHANEAWTFWQNEATTLTISTTLGVRLRVSSRPTHPRPACV